MINFSRIFRVKFIPRSGIPSFKIIELQVKVLGIVAVQQIQPKQTIVYDVGASNSTVKDLLFF